MQKDRDDIRAMDILAKYVGKGLINSRPGDQMELARLSSDIIEFVLDARIEERSRATGEDFKTAENSVVAALRPQPKGKK
jgi:hypothetical protein